MTLGQLSALFGYALLGYVFGWVRGRHLGRREREGVECARVLAGTSGVPVPALPPPTAPTVPLVSDAERAVYFRTILGRGPLASWEHC